MLFILVMCLMPESKTEAFRFQWMPSGSDKWIHGFFYFILFFLIKRDAGKVFLHPDREESTPGGKPLRKGKQKIIFLAGILIFCTTYGIAIELFQHFFTTTRHFELADIGANFTGSLLGFLIAVFVIPRRK